MKSCMATKGALEDGREASTLNFAMTYLIVMATICSLFLSNTTIFPFFFCTRNFFVRRELVTISRQIVWSWWAANGGLLNKSIGGSARNASLQVHMYITRFHTINLSLNSSSVGNDTLCTVSLVNEGSLGQLCPSFPLAVQWDYHSIPIYHHSLPQTHLGQGGKLPYNLITQRLCYAAVYNTMPKC